MKHYVLAISLLVVFAVAVGDFAFRIWYPSTTPEYSVGGVVRPFMSAEGSESKRHLYLRRSWYLTEPPTRAWLQVMGQDQIDVFINGESVGRSPVVGLGRTAAVLGDITTYLHTGHNVIAVHAAQSYIDRAPQVAIDGQVEFADGSQTSLGQSDKWRAGDIYDHRGLFWYETEFHDSHWSKPRLGEPVAWRAQVNVPPRSVSEPRQSKWINPHESADGAAAMARDFVVPAAPTEGWLRVIATGPYRIAINGWLVVDDQADLAAVPPERPLERTFDVSAFMRSGKNVVSIAVTTPGETPRLRADLETTATSGERVYIATDETWKSAAGARVDWKQPALASEEWQPCKPEVGFVGVTPYQMKRELADVVPGVDFWLARAAVDGVFILFSGLVAAAGSYFVRRILERQGGPAKALSAVPFLALLPSALIALSADYATWDLGWTGRDVYKPSWLLALWAIVGIQWAALCVLAVVRPVSRELQLDASVPVAKRRWSYGAVACWGVLFAAALWLRARDIVAEPIHHDEVTSYAFTEGVLKWGFPGGQVDPDIPFGWCATSELTFYPTALCSFFVDDPRLVIRIPATFFSMATMALLAYIGWRWFNWRVAFVAASLFAFSPAAIGMADFGRYLSQVQFFTLLTMFLTYEAVRGKGTPPVGLLWGAAASFVAMYLSWEGTGFFGIGLAVAVLLHRRRSLKPILSSPSFYFACALLGTVVLGQYAHRVMQQTERIWYGEGINSLTIKPMWTYPNFDAMFFLTNTSWIRDAFLPMLGLYVGCLLTINHRWRFPLRFSIICVVINAEMMSFLLPLRTNRYSYHLSEILILISAAALVAGADALLQLTRGLSRFSAYRWYIAAVAGSLLVTGTVIGSGWVLRTSELENYLTTAYDIRQLRNPNWNAVTQYLLAHMGKNDAVIALYPHAENFEFGAQQGPNEEPKKVDYWLESKLIVQATLGDTKYIPLDRRSGAKMLYDLEQVKKLFAEHDRIWYCTMRYGHSKINEAPVSQFLRQHMDVVYEDFDASLLLRDRNSRPARVRLSEDDAGELASDYYLR